MNSLHSHNTLSLNLISGFFGKKVEARLIGVYRKSKVGRNSVQLMRTYVVRNSASALKSPACQNGIGSTLFGRDRITRTYSRSRRCVYM